MRERQGDIWRLAEELRVDAVCFTTNGFVTTRGENVMGAGIALEVKRRWPDIPARLGALLKEHGNRVFRLRVSTFGAELVSFPTKPALTKDGEPGFRGPSELPLIETGAAQLVEMADKFGWQQVLVPRPGCGLGGLSWEREVRPLLEPILDDRFLVVTN